MMEEKSADFIPPITEQVENKDKAMSSGSLPQSGQAVSHPFSVEEFLRTAKLPEEDMDKLVKDYAKKLAEGGLKEKKQLSLIDMDLLKSLGVLPFHAAAIAEVAKKLGRHLQKVNMWKRELIHEGVEANPGPTFQQLIDRLKDVLKGDYQFYDALLLELKSAAKGPESIVADTTDIQNYFKAQINPKFEPLRRVVEEAITFLNPQGTGRGDPKATDQIIHEMAESMKNIMKSLKKQEIYTKLTVDTVLDPWNHSVRTESEQGSFKASLVERYQRHGKDENHLRCMITDQDTSYKLVIASHLWMNDTNGVGLEVFGLQRNALSDPRNGLLLPKAVENAYYKKRVCFLYDPFKKAIFLKVLNPELFKKDVCPGKTFAAIDGKRLLLPTGVWPFRRILNWHARKSFEFASTRGWITNDPIIYDYFDLSEKSIVADETFHTINKPQDSHRMQPEVGDVVIAKWTDNKYYKAKILAIKNLRVTVNYIEYGNSLNIPLVDIKPFK